MTNDTNEESCLKGLDHIGVSLVNGELSGIFASRVIFASDLSELEREALSSGGHIISLNGDYFKLNYKNLCVFRDNVIKTYYYALE